MAKIEKYNAFAGRHWETGSVQNYYASCGLLAPHTGKPYSEALLMGVSGGVVMGYFTFAYDGYDPQARILTRNTFDPFERMLTRLGVGQQVRHTSKADRAQRILLETLEGGEAAIVWADTFSLPYNGLSFDDKNWAILPLLVYGYEVDGVVTIADRAHVALQVDAGLFDQARGRVKKYKHRLLTLDAPKEDYLDTAVQKGIWDCIKLFLEAPPKGAKTNFGLAAYQHLANMLTKPKQRRSWEKTFPAGRKQYAAMRSIYHDVILFGKGMNNHADRELYADFLDEAALILQNDGLTAVAQQFRQSAHAWTTLAEMILPAEIAPFQETRKIMLQQHHLFLTEGNRSLEKRVAIGDRLEALKGEMEADFPLNEADLLAFRERIATQVLHIHDLEQEAILALQEAVR